MISSSSMDNTKPKKMQENSKQVNLFLTSQNRNKDLIKSLNFSGFNLINNSRTNLCLNNISILNNNYLVESRRIPDNPCFICINQENIENNENDNKRKTEKSFLGKKTKKYRKTKKKRKIKSLFITSQTDEKLRSNINNISQDNITNLNIENSYSTESNFSNKAAENIYLFEKIFPKTEKPKVLYTNKNYELFKTSKEEIKKKGKWSYDEHIKFIKAYVNFGKDYVLIQKYIGSRNSTQIISHAQKFFKKLKKLKNNDFDFSDDNIKTLWDIFQLIEAKNKNNIDREKYIINTLISLCENMQKNEDNYLNKNNKLKYSKIRKAKEEKVDTNISSLGSEKNWKAGNFDEFSQNRNNNEDKKLIFENDEINNDLMKSNLNLNVNKFYPEEIDIYKHINIGQSEKEQKNDIFEDEKSYSCNYVNIDNYFNRNFKLDDDFIFLSGDSNLFFLSGKPFDSDKFSFASRKKSRSFNFPCE